LDIENSYLYEEGLEDNTGFLVYSNNTLLDLGVNEGDKVNFRKDSEYEFEVDGNLLYRMKSSDICTVL
jgi:co-chaperonin GroES (HSP10)